MTCDQGLSVQFRTVLPQTPDWLESVHAALDKVLAEDSGSLVTTGQGKFYSNGLDLEWIMEHADQLASYRADVQELLARVLTLPVPAVAAVNGHAFGAGAMFALAHDYRVMRADRGFFCFPEVDINIPFTPGMAGLIQGKLTPTAAVEAMTTGRRFGGVQARDRGLVDEVADEGAVVRAAVELVRPIAGKNHDTLGAIKSTMFASAVTALRTPEPTGQP
ncbi:enoyl-CoA hydratase-related protein [Saccharopolyspora montiporae]|uniref:enoyl-CoA hydratase-related protein n=1 Tax=Saccharopolyspora montiporae TaxID=2781240 RepID=UPI001D133693|nr:enoyl-CoA hydratase-related protein [Saccharopolyspora sp. HNM0983]